MGGLLVGHFRVAGSKDRAQNAADSVFRIARHAKLADAECPHCPIIVS